MANNKNLVTEKAKRNRFKKGHTPWSKGKKLGYNKKQADKMKGREMPEYQRQKISQKLKGKSKPIGFGIGKKHTIETKEKISKSKKGVSTSINTEFKKGHKLSIESAFKHKMSLTGKISPKRGIPLSQEIKNKIRIGVVNLFHKRNDSPTSIEVKMEKWLTEEGYSFISQKGIGGHYVADFFVFPNTLIECDGDYWHSSKQCIQKDRRKNGYYKKEGFRVIRLNESLINNYKQKCLDIISNKNVIFFTKDFETNNYDWEIKVVKGEEDLIDKIMEKAVATHKKMEKELENEKQN